MDNWQWTWNQKRKKMNLIIFVIIIFVLFSVRVRSEALKRLSWYLTNEENSTRKLPVVAELDVTNLSNIFIVDTPRSVDEDLGRSVFQVRLLFI